ncbi:MAG: alpha-L-fucosidase [Clostridia bacterium]
MSFVDEIVKVVPNQSQINIEKMGFYAFITFGMNTITDKEWGDGKTPVTMFNPANLDTDQWCRIIANAGMKGVILTVKHHDGFCLWHTKSTKYSVEFSPYKRDILKQLQLSCQKYQLKLGVYLSPWDRNSEFYSTDKYDDFFCAQIEEVLSNYGEVFAIWFDGACGAYMDGKQKQNYDYARYFKLCKQLQPNCAISNCGPDVRWVGNEAGKCRKNEFNVVPKSALDIDYIQQNSQQDVGFKENLEVASEDLGSRKVLSKYNEFMWYPAEVDVSIRPGWFYHKKEDNKVRKVNNLLNIYYNSVGGNALLLLNIPPNSNGLIAKEDEERLVELNERLASAFAKKVVVKDIQAEIGKVGYEIENLKETTGAYSPQQEGEVSINLKFAEVTIDKVVLAEDITFSQRVEKFEISSVQKGEKVVLYSGQTIGHKKIALFEKPCRCDNLTVLIIESRRTPYINMLEIYETDNNLPLKEKEYKLKNFFAKINYKIYTQSIKRKQAKIK